MGAKKTGRTDRRKKGNSPDGAERFHAWYRQMLGSRWDSLVPACQQPVRHFALSRGLKTPYFLDPASVLAALSLGVEPGHRVLDLCAAPGGKTLVLALGLLGLAPAGTSLETLGSFPSVGHTAGEAGPDMDPETTEIPEGPDTGAMPDSEDTPEESTGTSDLPVIPGPGISLPEDGGCLVANERSPSRRGRLRQVLCQRLDGEFLSRVRIFGHDAATWGVREQDMYDRVLLDVPCSSERHLLQAPSWLEEWSPRRSDWLSRQAYAMGLSAGRALKAGGILAYCTCALSDLENDKTVARIIARSRAQEERYGYRLESLPPAECTDAMAAGETTEFGIRFWPDRGGFGPLYIARLRKVTRQD